MLLFQSDDNPGINHQRSIYLKGSPPPKQYVENMYRQLNIKNYYHHVTCGAHSPVVRIQVYIL